METDVESGETLPSILELDYHRNHCCSLAHQLRNHLVALNNKSSTNAMLQRPNLSMKLRQCGRAEALLESEKPQLLQPARPNPSLNHRTRYGKRRKPGLRHMVHHLSPGLRRLPPQAG